MASSASHGSRRFYNFSDEKPNHRKDHSTRSKKPVDKLLRYIEENCIGRNTIFSGPYGFRKVVYCDYIASGRDIIRNAVNAGEGDAVIFTGSGCTAAVHKLIHALHLQQPPIVFVGPYEHHSNLLPWKEAGAEIVWISQDGQGVVDVNDLDQKLQTYISFGRQLIGCFAAASNVTGILVDTNSITACLHRHGALALWDYATAGPYIEINMNPVITSKDQSLVYKDAIFISTHKFIGGVGTPGILVAKKKLFRNPVPSGGGGGSVFFVTENSHRYLKETEMREEGGTPAIVESIRAGLVFQLKEAVGHDVIFAKETEMCRKALDAWSDLENLVLLGSTTPSRLPVFSFLVRHPVSGLFLHHNYTCALLNDLFGIQARGGCACAGPYAQDLLGIDEKLAKRFEALLLEDSRLDRGHLRRYNEYSEHEILRPGFVRLNFPYFMSEDSAAFVRKAVLMVAESGWKLLPQYMFNPETGEWRHRKHKVFHNRKWLGSISYSTGELTYPSFSAGYEALPKDLQECLSNAEEIFRNAEKMSTSLSDQSLFLGEEAEKLRWFVLPSESAVIISGQTHGPRRPPFVPKIWPRDAPDLKVRSGINKDGLVNGIATGTVDKGNISTNEIFTGNNSNELDCQSCKERGKNLSNFSGSASILQAMKNQRIGNGSIDRGTNEKGLIEISNETCNSTTTNDCNSETNEDTRNSNEIFCASKTSDASCSNTYKQACNSNNECRACLQPRGKHNGTNVNTTLAEVNTVRQEDGFKPKFCNPPKAIFKPTVQAIEEYSMINDGDRVLVCLSGGKDSLSLLHTLHQYQYQARAKGLTFHVGAATVDPQSSAYDPRPLIPYLATLGVPYFFEEQDIIQQAADLPVCESICSFCSRMKRGRLYACARRHGYNVLALGQHLDDLAESFIMSVFHNGLLRTMKANYTVQEGDLRIIRPFVYVREKDLREFSTKAKFPVIPENCPACFEQPKERHRTKQLLAAQEILFPGLYPSLLTAMKPLMARNRVGMETSKIKTGEFEGIS
ncbi:uncharacterized protein LOC5522122 [Nematostella vectensis]|uniref:uncharacterized protein LOC5522122 n=1 Tax=Nematostella vectensis TaxID=45351 RepID=UPI002076D670|nr:uncharacterized protein LOC5522122 [Nematostella vectensis]